MVFIRSAEGECENSQAKGLNLDDTLESEMAPTKQFSANLIVLDIFQ